MLQKCCLCLVTDVNGCLQESDMVYSIYKEYLKWLKRELVDRLMVCAIKCMKHYTEPSSDASHHAHRLPSSFGDECASGVGEDFLGCVTELVI